MTVEEYRQALAGLSPEQFRRFRESWGGTKETVEGCVQEFAYAKDPLQWIIAQAVPDVLDEFVNVDRPHSPHTQKRPKKVSLPRFATAHSLYYSECVTPIERVTTLRIPDDLLKAMQALKQRDGVPFSEQIRRALRPWLESKGVLKAERRQVANRKRS